MYSDNYTYARQPVDTLYVKGIQRNRLGTPLNTLVCTIGRGVRHNISLALLEEVAVYLKLRSVYQGTP